MCRHCDTFICSLMLCKWLLYCSRGHGRPFLISDQLVQESEGEIRANQRVTITELHHIIPEVSETTIHEAVTEKLGYRKLCAGCVPKILTDNHKKKLIAYRFVRREHQSFLRKIHGTTSSQFADS